MQKLPKVNLAQNLNTLATKNVVKFPARNHKYSGKK